VIVILDTPNAGLEGITDNTRVLAVVMPHQQGIRRESWDIKVDGQPKYITTVREIEKLTGYNFLSNVPPAVQDVIETKVDQGS
jgi:endonuclease G, mitochondrial